MVWKKVLVAKSGERVELYPVQNNVRNSQKKSMSWRDICKVGRGLEGQLDWFNETTRKKSRKW